MSKADVLYTRYGEMRDLINCYLIDQGDLLPKNKARKLSYDEIMALL